MVRRLPGVTFPGVNRSRDIKLRGIPKEYTQVLLDGRPLLDGDTSRNIEVDRVPASFIERIEITRTPLASMDSMGAAGTVNIITRRSFGASGGQLTMGAGRMEDNGTPGEISGWQGGESGPLRYFIGGGYQRRLVQESANEFTFKGDGSPDGGELGPQHRKFDEYTLLSRFELAVDPANTIVVAPSYLRTTERRDQNALRLSDDQTYVDRDTHEMRERIRETYGANVEWQHDFGYATASPSPRWRWEPLHARRARSWPRRQPRCLNPSVLYPRAVAARQKRQRAPRQVRAVRRQPWSPLSWPRTSLAWLSQSPLR